MIPPAFYLNNSMVSSVNVPMPGHPEREHFVDTNRACLNISQDIVSDKNAKDDLIDALDGFSLKDIAQMMKLSRQMEERMSFEKLLNLFKYGRRLVLGKSFQKERLSESKKKKGVR